MYFAEFTNPKLYNSGNIKTVKLKLQNKKNKKCRPNITE